MNARWVPFKLNESQMRVRVQSSHDILSIWEENWTKLIDRIVTTDETSVSYENTDSRNSAAEWREKGFRRPEIPKLSSDKRKIMATVFRDSEGVLMVDILPPNKTVDALYYCELLDRLRGEIQSKRRGKLSKGIILLHDNARPHTTTLTTDKFKELGWSLLPYPPYSPDLAPSDFFLLENLEIFLREKICREKEELEREISNFFDQKPIEFYASAFKQFRSRLHQCITNKGQYI